MSFGFRLVAVCLNNSINVSGRLCPCDKNIKNEQTPSFGIQPPSFGMHCHHLVLFRVVLHSVAVFRHTATIFRHSHHLSALQCRSCFIAYRFIVFAQGCFEFLKMAGRDRVPVVDRVARLFGNLKHGLATDYIKWVFENEGFTVTSLTNSDRIIDGTH